MQQSKFSTEKILSGLKIKELNEMQVAAIDAIGQNDEVILLSATGSGKTLAFLLPTLELIDADNKNTQALIIVPSRELAQQIEEVFRSMATGLKITSCYGGHLRETEENNLVQPPAVIVGTPGRLCDHIRRNNITVDAIKTLILDEFDKSLELGFEEEMSFILNSLPNVNKKILTSATEALEMPVFIGLKDPVNLNFLPEHPAPAEKLAIKTVISDENDKLETLFKLICYLGNRPTIVFCNHRESVERTSKFLADKKIINTFYHGGMEQQQRDSALCKFRNGTVSFLITTDLAARGLDIPDIRYIVHYHLPLNEESFIHRNGRTARMDATGTAILILSPEEHLPAYIDATVEPITLSEEQEIPEAPKWITLFIAAGKKDKINKVDIVGFLAQKGELKKEDIGLIDVKDFFSFVAIRKSKATNCLQLIKNEKIKNKKVLIAVAK
jgi:ATP-dependent RNA helicase DeaD